MRKFRQHQEPIGLQDLLNSAHSQAEKKVQCLPREHWKLYFTNSGQKSLDVGKNQSSPYVQHPRIPTFSRLTCLDPRVPESPSSRISQSSRPRVPTSQVLVFQVPKSHVLVPLLVTPNILGRALFWPTNMHVNNTNVLKGIERESAKYFI